MRYSIVLAVVIFAGQVLAFGVPDTPDVPDVPDVEVPEIEIPGLDLLDGVQSTLDEVIGSTENLRGILPELGTLDELSAKLDELTDMDPEIASLQAELDALRGELVAARDEIQAVVDTIDSEIAEVKTTIDTFVDGLPIAPID